MTREEAKRRMEICRDFLANNYSDMGEPNFTAFNMAIKALSQEPKSGKWIDINGIYAECSNCNEEIYITGDFNYCPNCGCRMVEPQESEDK